MSEHPSETALPVVEPATLPPSEAVETPPPEGFLGVLATAEKALFFVEQFVLLFLLFILVGLSFGQLFLHNLGNWGLEWAGRWSQQIFWADSLLRHLVLVLAFVGASLTTREGRHLSIDVLGRLLKPRARAVLRLFLAVFSSVISVLLAHAAYQMILFEIDAPSAAFRIGLKPVPSWYFFLAMLVCLLLMALRFLIRGGQDFWLGWTGRLKEEAPAL